MNVCSSLFDLQGDPSLLVVSHSDLTGDLYESRYSALGARMNLHGGGGAGGERSGVRTPPGAGCSKLV